MTNAINRRQIIKGAAASAAAGAVAVNSITGSAAAPSTFHVPTYLKPSSPVKVTFWSSFSGALGEAETALVERFNIEQTDIKLNYQFQGTYEETAQKLTAAIAANNAPDISLLSDVWWFKFYLNNALAPLNDLMAAASVDTSDYVDSLIKEGNRDGVQYWVPFARSTPLFYYNRELFAAAGLDRAPETWDEIVALKDGIVTKDGDTITRSLFAHPSSGSYIAWLFQRVVWQFGGESSDAEFNVKLHQGGAIPAGEFYRSSVADGWATTPEDVVADFVGGLTASMMASTGGLAGITRDATFDFGTAFLPKAEGFGCCTGGAGLALMAGSAPEMQEAAYQCMAWASSPEITAWWSQNTGYMPVRKSAIESPEMQEFFTTNPNFKVAVDQLALTKPQDAARTFIPNGDQIIGAGLERITINGEDVQTVFDEVAATLNEEAQLVIETIAAL